MRDLRKQALESHKKPSRKAQAKLASTNASPRGSKPASRHGSTLNTPIMSRTASTTGSRVNSDDEEYLSDETFFSGSDLQQSIDDLGIDSTKSWEDALGDRIQELLEWKRSTAEGRELCLRTFTRMLQARYSNEETTGREQDLVASFLRSIKNEASESEVLWALKATEMLMVTSGEELLYESAGPTIERTISYSSSIDVKVQAIRTLAFLTFYGGASDEEVLRNMDFFLEIVDSDGTSIEAEDAPEPVTAALEAYSFLATLIDDLSDQSAEHTEIVMEQLESTSTAVQIAAGEAIALLFEKSYTEPEEEELGSKPDHTHVFNDNEKLALIRRYQASDNYREVIGRLEMVASTSGRSSRRKDLKAARVSFKDILHSIENPTHGPKYSTAMDKEGTRVYGSRLNVKIGSSGVMKIDKWWKLITLQNLKRVLQGGFLEHYERNALIFDALPVLMS